MTMNKTLCCNQYILIHYFNAFDVQTTKENRGLMKTLHYFPPLVSSEHCLKLGMITSTGGKPRNYH